MTEKIVIAYVCDDRYLPYLKKSMDSVRRYNKNVEFAILASRELTVPGAKVYTFLPDTDKFKYKPNDRMKEGVYYKLYLTQLPYDKVIYMDCDVVCQRPLNPLWEEKCDFICATESHNYGKVQAAELHLQKYALTGMMVMNLKALREYDFTNKCLAKLAEINPKWHDETVINLVMKDKIRFIDKKYNYCRNREYDNPIPESDAYLLHYVGGQKQDMLKRTRFLDLWPLWDKIEGKSVAIVGNSQELISRNQGKEIDAHDTVIRLNKGFPRAEIGLKTDILFLACTLSPSEMSRFVGAFTVQRSKLCKNVCHYKISTMDRTMLIQEANPYCKELRKPNSQPSTGFIAINFALEANAKKIDLYGFDFFERPTYYNPKGYQTLHNGEKEKEKVLEYQKWGLVNIK